MEFFELVERRHSVRSFTGEPVEQAAITRILKAALSAPSAKNTRSSSFMVVEEPELIGRIARMRDYGSAFVEKAPLVILVMGDQLRSDLWEVNAAISATYVQLAAQALELGSCWVHVAGRPQRREEPGGPAAEDYLRSFLPVPEGRRILCAVAIGHTAEPAPIRKEEIPDADDRVVILPGDLLCRERCRHFSAEDVFPECGREFPVIRYYGLWRINPLR